MAMILIEKQRRQQYLDYILGEPAGGQQSRSPSGLTPWICKSYRQRTQEASGDGVFGRRFIRLATSPIRRLAAEGTGL
jgi:hypothetical protein